MVRALPGPRRDVQELPMENHGVVTNEDLAGCGLMRRQTAVVALGWRPLRFTWDDVVKDPYGTAAAVERALAA